MGSKQKLRGHTGVLRGRVGSEQKLQSKSASLQVKEVLPHTAASRGGRVGSEQKLQSKSASLQVKEVLPHTAASRGGRVGSEQKLHSKSASLQVKEVLPHTAASRGRGIRAKTAEQIGFLTGQGGAAAHGRFERAWDPSKNCRANRLPYRLRGGMLLPAALAVLTLHV